MADELHVVTGGAGFIGSNLVRALLEEGFRVRVLDDFSTGRKENLADVEDDVEVVNGDVRDADLVSEVVDGASVVYHQAAIPSVARSVAQPVPSHEANINGTLNVLLAARDAGASRVVFASSSSVYGDVKALPVHEELPPRPLSPYAVSKLTGEAYCRAFATSYGLPTVALRYFNVFGPSQNPLSEYAAVVPRFATSVLRGTQATIFGDGEQTRDFTFVEDVVRANRRAAEAPEAAFGEAFNVGQGGRTTVNQLLALLQKASGQDPVEPVRAPPRVGETRDSQAEVSKARSVLGHEARVSLEEGLGRTLEWFRAQGFGEDR
jgi:UDP-glucose 4-epimerase